MSKSKLKRLLEYCPRPKNPLTTTLKRYAIPTTMLISVSIVLFSFFLLFGSTPVQPMQQALPPPLPTVTGEYVPGVSVGNYVTYGNFICNIDHQGEGWICIKDLAFKKVEVIEVSGKEVTFLYTQQYNNGSKTSIHGCTETWDVEYYFWSDDEEYMFEYGLIIAANLTEGYSIHSQTCSFPNHIISKTEARTYWGAIRNVNLLISNQDIQVYDLETGFLLESEQFDSNDDIISSMSIVETNIFSTPTSSLQENTTQSST